MTLLRKCILQVKEEPAQSVMESFKRKMSIFKNRKIFLMIIASMINWFTNSFVYTGLSYNIDFLGGDPYLNFLYSSLAEFAGVLSKNFFKKRLNLSYHYLVIIFVRKIVFKKSLINDFLIYVLKINRIRICVTQKRGIKKI